MWRFLCDKNAWRGGVLCLGQVIEILSFANHSNFDLTGLHAGGRSTRIMVVSSTMVELPSKRFVFVLTIPREQGHEQKSQAVSYLGFGGCADDEDHDEGRTRRASRTVSC